MSLTLDYPFTESEMHAASTEWGCNCGPSALAFAIQQPLEVARRAIPDFDSKKYTSPTMMQAALKSLGISYRGITPPDRASMFSQESQALVRIQWLGPWTEPGANPKWAYWHTHWITTWMVGAIDLLFDCNGGVNRLANWEQEIVPLLMPKRGSGWRPTHIWRLTHGATPC